MDSTVHALQNLYVKKGGNLTDTYPSIAGGIPVADYATIPDLIEAVSMLGGGGGGGETFTVTFTEIQGSSGGDFTPDKTVAQAKAAYDAGQKVVGVISGSQDYSGVTLDAYNAGETDGDTYVDFKGCGPVYADGDSFNSFKFYRLRLFDYEGEPAVLVNMTNIT